VGVIPSVTEFDIVTSYWGTLPTSPTVGAVKLKRRSEEDIAINTGIYCQ
jgi:hypothetical protein